MMLITNIATKFKKIENIKNHCKKFNFTKYFFHTNGGRFSKPNLSSFEETQRNKNKSTLYYVTAAGVLVVGLSYAAVPLYRMFCQTYSYGGTTASGHDASKVESMTVVKSKPLKIRFNADTATSMRWNFKPQQSEIIVRTFFILYSN